MRTDCLTVIGIRRLCYWSSCCLHLQTFLVLRESLVETSIKFMAVFFRNRIHSIFITVFQSSSELRNVHKSDIVGEEHTHTHKVLFSRFLQRCQCHSGVPGCDAVSLGKRYATFRWKVLVSFSKA